MSANIFSVLILILIIFLAARANPNSSSVEVLPDINIDIEKELASIERSPLSSDELFDLLYERNETMASIKVDLLSNGITVVSRGKTDRFGTLEDAVLHLGLLASVSNRASIGIYIFNNRFYRGITDKLKALGWTWREVSVPEALKGSDATKQGASWSAGFSKILVAPADRAQFRSELARLLQSSTSREHSALSGGAAGGSQQSPDTIVKAFLRWAQNVLKVAALVTGAAFVLWVEIRYRRMSRPLPG